MICRGIPSEVPRFKEIRWFPADARCEKVVPFNQFLLKVASRCNLACPYCYVYELKDQGWRAQPNFMKESTLKCAVARIKEHIVQHRLPTLSVIFHGGEPLLLGPHRLDTFADYIRRQLSGIAEIRLGLQTNGTLLDDRVLEVAKRQGIRIGLSIDGPPAHHDKFRFYHDTTGSARVVENAARMLCASPEVFGGVLCVVSLEADPLEVFQYFFNLRVPRIDLLLPHGTHDYLPPGVNSREHVVRYGEWLGRFLEAWYKTRDNRPDIRFFFVYNAHITRW